MEGRAVSPVQPGKYARRSIPTLRLKTQSAIGSALTRGQRRTEQIHNQLVVLLRLEVDDELRRYVAAAGSRNAAVWRSAQIWDTTQIDDELGHSRCAVICSGSCSGRS